jgi:hypothetical protein
MFRKLKSELDVRFSGGELEVTREQIPGDLKGFDVYIEGKLVHSKCNGDGNVDTEEKLEKLYANIEEALKV